MSSTQLLDLEGRRFMEEENWKGALGTYLRLTQVDPSRPAWHGNLSTCYLQMGALACAKNAAQKCIELGSRYVGGYYALADVYDRLCEYEHEEEVLEKGLVEVPFDRKLRNMIGRCRAMKKLDESAQEEDGTISFAQYVKTITFGEEQCGILLGDGREDLTEEDWVEALERFDGLTSEGIKCFEESNWLGAAEAWKKFVLVDPEAHKCWGNLSTCYLLMESFADAKDAAQKCIELDPQYVKAYCLISDVHRALNEDDEAENILEQGLSKVPNDPNMKTMLVGLREKRRKWDSFDLQKYLGSVTIDEHNFKILVGDGRELLTDDDAKEACDQLALLVAESSRYQKEGNWTAAAALLEKLTLAHPICPLWWGGLSKCYLQMGLMPKAEVAAKKCIEADPDITVGYHVLSHVYNRLGDHDQEEEVLKQGLDLDPIDIDLQDMLSRCRISQKEQEQVRLAKRGDLGVTDFLRSFTIDEGSFQVLVGGGGVLSTDEDVKKAEDELIRVATEGSRNLEERNWSAAAAAFEKVTRAYPDCPIWWAVLSKTYVQMGLLDEGKTTAEKCIELDPNNIAGYIALANVHHALSEHDREEEALKRGLAFEPFDSTLNEMMAKCRITQREKEQFREVTLTVPESSFVYFGGHANCKFPRNTAYGRLKRPSMPPLSRKFRDLSKFSKDVRPVLESFFNGELRVKWYGEENSWKIEGYVPDEPSPVMVIYRRCQSWGSDGVMYTSQAIDKRAERLSVDDRQTLAIILFQRFLREKGSQLLDMMSEQELGGAVQNFTNACKDLGYYKDSVDLRMAHADILISKGCTSEVNFHIVKLGEDLEFAKQYSVAGEIYAELAGTQKLNCVWGPKAPPGVLHCNAGLAYKRAQDFKHSEKHYVAALKEVGSDVLELIPDGSHEHRDLLENTSMLYAAVNEMVVCGLRNDEVHHDMQRAGYLLTALLSLAGFRVNVGLFDCADQYQTALKERYKTKHKARQAIINAIKAPSVDQYHERLFECQQGNKKIVQFMRPSVNVEEHRSNILNGQKSHNKQSARVDTDEFSKAGVFLILCAGCNETSNAREMKDCPCRTVRYCNKKCQNEHWKAHKKVCPTRKKSRKKE